MSVQPPTTAPDPVPAVPTPTSPVSAVPRRRSVPTPVRRPSFARLTSVELRKTFDTRAGRALLALVAAITVFAAGWQVTHPEGSTVTFGDMLDATSGGMVLLIPVLGVLSMTSEWTQRTALVTFTLSPRRGRVIGAKLVAAVGLGVGSAAVAAALAIGATVLGASLHDQQIVWGDLSTLLPGSLLASALMVLMGSAVGALLGHTAAAITVYYVLPTAWAIIASNLLQEREEWLNVFSAVERLSAFDVAGHVPMIATATSFWIVLPLVLGTLRSLRRNVS